MFLWFVGKFFLTKHLPQKGRDKPIVVKQESKLADPWDHLSNQWSHFEEAALGLSSEM